MIQYIHRMKLLIAFLIPFCEVSAKEPDAAKLLAEGKLLYRLERASWLATDHLLDAHPEIRDSIGGYLSYPSDEGVTTIFFRRDDPHHLLRRYHFDHLPEDPIKIETNGMAAENEKDLIAIRQDAIAQIMANEDGHFRFYENASFNPIPLITGKERKVYILTGPQVEGVVLLGNDHLLTYDRRNKCISRKKLHNTLITFPTRSDESAGEAESTIHSHVNSAAIDVTDICTLLLYKDYVTWKQHLVISKTHVSIFNLEKEELVIMTRKAWDRMANDQGKR
jgi:hypothetical protein